MNCFKRKVGAFMGSLGMNGPYDFNKDSIDINVTKVSGGNYALGFVDNNLDNFHVTYVGRSDSDVREKLKKQLIEMKNRTSRFEARKISFKYSYASSPKEAYEKECFNYHNFEKSKKLSNNIHPEKPSGENCKCPICND